MGLSVLTGKVLGKPRHVNDSTWKGEKDEALTRLGSTQLLHGKNSVLAGHCSDGGRDRQTKDVTYISGLACSRLRLRGSKTAA